MIESITQAPKGKGKGKPIKKQKIQDGRAWVYFTESASPSLERNSHETKYQLIYDHLEDSVLAPRLCQYCSDTNCDGQNCESPFDPNDYNEASLFFTQSLSQLVINAKLDRSLDSHAPQTEYKVENPSAEYLHWTLMLAISEARIK